MHYRTCPHQPCYSAQHASGDRLIVLTIFRAPRLHLWICARHLPLPCRSCWSRWPSRLLFWLCRKRRWLGFTRTRSEHPKLPKEPEIRGQRKPLPELLPVRMLVASPLLMNLLLVLMQTRDRAGLRRSSSGPGPRLRSERMRGFAPTLRGDGLTVKLRRCPKL